MQNQLLQNVGLFQNRKQAVDADNILKILSLENYVIDLHRLTEKCLHGIG
jgi:hypothetical protein